MPDISEGGSGKRAPDAARIIGARLKAARQAQRLTLDDLAATCGLTKGYLSKIERGNSSASVATLIRICGALELPVGSLFEAAPVGDVVRAGAYPPIAFGGERMAEYLLSPRSERRLQVLLSEIEPGGGSGTEAYALPVDVEFVLVLDGELRIEVSPAGDSHTPIQDAGPAAPTAGSIDLGAGDALTFTPSRQHAFTAIGPAGARVLWVLAPALPEGGR
ncbi:helix-turn-helix domain-containing protein [Hoyosella sp. YIM 151337]|uniref:helix-turn-helix domain-containing protein n=1 Tax=Hoyosella sp. YIM 151337 TaxID=2992742 RepID=UPI0035A84DCE